MTQSEAVIKQLSQPVLSVVIPAFNEEDGIEAVINRVLSVRSSLGRAGVCGLELIVVDDGSHDHTREIVGACPDVRLICHPVNKGYGAALKTGFNAARGDLVAFLDADGTYPPESFPELCRAALDGGEMVVGSRRSGAKSEMPFVRQLGNFIWSTLLTALTGEKVADPASGMRVMQRDVLKRLYPLPDGLNFTPVMSTRAIHEGVKVVELPIAYKERLGRSKLSVVRDGLRFLQTILWTALNYNPVRILGGVGVVLLAISAVLGLVLVVLRLSGVTELGPWGIASTFAALALAMGGVDLFSLGATFNYLVSLFHERPVRQGLFGKPIFKTPLDRQFWWMGLLSGLVGVIFGIGSLIAGLEGWPMERLWLYLLAGTMLVLIGMQLFLFWIIMRVLEELSQRKLAVQNDLDAV